jgi:hypothetical protein
MIIGLTGKKQNGKSTAAQYIAEKYGFVRVNFKDALIAEIKQNFPKLLEEIARTTDFKNGIEQAIDDLFVTKPPLMRALLQNYGTEVRRRDHDDYWVVQWLKRASKEKNVVVDDVRFLNEAQAVRDMGGSVIRIFREDYMNVDTHVSESEMDKIHPDYVISVKTGEQDVLYRAIDEFILQVQHQ